jgi:acyl-CoA thioesterase
VTVDRSLPLADASRLEGTAGRYTARLSPEWGIWGPNGGYLATIALRAAGLCAELPHPAGVYATFLRSPRFDEVRLDVTPLKQGRRAETFAVTMTQDEQPVLSAVVRTAAVVPGYDRPAPAPEIPPPTDCAVTESGGRFPFWSNLERRATADDGETRLREWLRFRPDAPVDDPFLAAARSLILLDTYGWPTAWRTHGDGPYIAPNLDIAAWFYPAANPTEWLLVDYEYQVGHLGRLGVAGRVWDADGRLVATGGGQLLCVPA